jgi:hypothetical protein
MTRELLAVVGSLAVLLAGAVYCAVTYRQRWLDLRDKSDALLSRLNRAEGSIQRQIELGAYRIPPEKAPSVLRDIFRPMGVPSTERDVEQERLARQARRQRALTQPFHTTRFTVDATNDSEAAREILTSCCGGLEVEE